MEGSSRNLNKNYLKMGGGWVKAEIVCRGEGILKKSPPMPPPTKILIVHKAAENRYP